MKKLFTCLVSFVIINITFSQTGYYVSTTGDNGNSGAIDLPWETVQYGIDQLSPGDVLNIMAGTYNEKIQFNNSGNSDNYLTLQNYNDDEVIIDGSGISDFEAIIEIYDQSYIVIEGLRIANNEMSDAQGILVENNCSNIMNRQRY